MQALSLLDAALEARELLESGQRHALCAEHRGLLGEDRRDVVRALQEQNACPGGEHRARVLASKQQRQQQLV